MMIICDLFPTFVVLELWYH